VFYTYFIACSDIFPEQNHVDTDFVLIHNTMLNNILITRCVYDYKHY